MNDRGGSLALSTPRLALLPLQEVDGDDLHALFIQPGVRRVIFDDAIIPMERTTEILRQNTALFRDRGFGLWGAWHPDDPRPIGFAGLWYFREPPELELLYGVDDSWVGQGYGTEIANAVVDFALNELRMTAVRASTAPGHSVSIRVLERLGFRFERRETVDGIDTVFYELRRDH